MHSLKVATLAAVAAIVLSQTAIAQSIAPPQPDYSRYGSQSQRLTVYTNTRLEVDRLERLRYTKFREEVRRLTPAEPARESYYVRTNRCHRCD